MFSVEHENNIGPGQINKITHFNALIVLGGLEVSSDAGDCFKKITNL